MSPAPRHPGSAPFQRLRELQIPWIWIFVAAAVLLAVFVFGMQQNDARLQRLLETEAEMQEAVALREQQVLDIQRDLSTVGTMSYIEVHARSDHGYLRPGEIRFHIDSKEVLNGYTQEEMQFIMDELVFNQ